MKKDEAQFKNWESRCFGSGYGTGEMPIMIAVKKFFSCLEGDREYQYETLESKLGDTVTWLLINAFAKANVIEWGTSARFGWLTSCGEFLRDFLKQYTAEQLYDILMSDDDNSEWCCMCDGDLAKDYTGHEECDKNPFVHEKYANKLLYSK